MSAKNLQLEFDFEDKPKYETNIGEFLTPYHFPIGTENAIRYKTKEEIKQDLLAVARIVYGRSFARPILEFMNNLQNDLNSQLLDYRRNNLIYA